MLSALSTLAFLATLWLVGAVAIRTLEESGARIAAALAGLASEYRGAEVVELPVRMPASISPERRLAAA